MERLEAIVRQLEQGNVPLEESLKLFQEGTKLVQGCTKPVSYTHLLRRAVPGGIIAFHLILQPGERERQPIHLHTEILRRIRLPAQRIERLARRKLQSKQLARPVDELSGGDVARSAELFGADVLPCLLYTSRCV